MKIEIEHVSKKIKDALVLDDVCMTLESGNIYGFQGVNGSGKTMLMRAVSGLMYPTSGTISIDGKVLGKNMAFPEKIGMLIENPAFIDSYTGYDNLKMLASINKGEVDISGALETVGLNPHDKRKYRKYSLGMKQRLGIANAILHDPELLILDEPTNGLDPIGIAEVRDFIKTLSIERGKTILISSHILSEIALLADDIGIIDHGVLLEENSMNELQKKNSKYILLQVSDIPKTSLVLERQFGVTEYSVQDEHTLRIYDTSLDMAAVNKALVVQDIAVISSQLCNDTLEDYFKKITGGEGIA